MSTERNPLSDKELWQWLSAEPDVAPAAVSDLDFAAWLEGRLSETAAARIEAAVAADPEMRMDGYAEADVDGHLLRYDNEGLAVWTAYSGHGKDGNMAWFDYRDGRIVVKNPDDEIIAKMKRIATNLRAKVLGDEGESYMDGESQEGQSQSRRCWWKFW